MSNYPTLKMPRKTARSHALLQTLLIGPGTFYQLCERAGIEIEYSGDECNARIALDGLMRIGAVLLDGIIYRASIRAHAAVATTYIGQPAAPHYRGPCMTLPVTHIRAVVREARI